MAWGQITYQSNYLSIFWSDLGSKLIFMLSRMAHSTYLYCLFDVFHNNFELADQKTSFSYGHEFMNVVSSRRHRR